MDGEAATSSSMFRLETSVSTRINAPASTIWHLLTDIDEQRRWNSTLASLSGRMALGGQVAFSIKEAPKQTFRPSIIAFDDGTLMVWMVTAPMLVSTRTYRLAPGPDGSTEFSLDEVFEGFLLPLVRWTFPDFRRMFEQTAADLKAAAEREGKA